MVIVKEFWTIFPDLLIQPPSFLENPPDSRRVKRIAKISDKGHDSDVMIRHYYTLLILLIAFAGFSAMSVTAQDTIDSDAADVTDTGKEEMSDSKNLEVATVGGGCFWCTEAVLERVDGVVDVVSGYMGGHVENPTYEQICTKTTGHAEVIQVTFDRTEISFEEILDIFWQAHDPTTINQQGADRGPQYRSVIFFHSPEQKNLAEESKKALDASGAYSSPAVTQVSEASTFWEAEGYHQDYYRLNKDKNPYCRVVITPKMKKLGFE